MATRTMWLPRPPIPPLMASLEVLVAVSVFPVHPLDIDHPILPLIADLNLRRHRWTSVQDFLLLFLSQKGYSVSSTRIAQVRMFAAT